jgi:hypothetical protein
MSYKPVTLITVSPSVVRFQDVPSSFPSTNICPLRLLTLSPCHPQARTPSPSRVPLRHRKARAFQPPNRTRRVAQAMWNDDCFIITFRWLLYFGYLSQLVCAEPAGCTRHAHAPTSPSCWCRRPSGAFDSAQSCLTYSSGRLYGHETTANDLMTPSAAASEHWLEDLTGI